MAFSIQTLGPGDLAAFRSMLAMFGRAFDDPRSYAARPPSDAYLQRLLARDTFIAIAASEAGNVVAGLAAYVLPKFEQERSEVYIYDLAVAEPYRRKGIATALVEELRKAAALRGAYVIFVQADRDDEPAIALYTKLGVREDVLHFDIAV